MNSVIGWIPVNERFCVIRIKGALYNTCFIYVHSPTEDADSVDKDTFYDQMDLALGACPAHDSEVIIGDFNAKVGKAHVSRIQTYTKVLGFSLTEGERIRLIVMDVRSYRGANIDSDLFLVMMIESNVEAPKCKAMSERFARAVTLKQENVQIN